MADIWWIPEEQRFWMERPDPLETATFLDAHPRAILVTNPEEMTPELLAQLEREAHG